MVFVLCANDANLHVLPKKEKIIKQLCLHLIVDSMICATVYGRKTSRGSMQMPYHALAALANITIIYDRP